MLLLGLVGRVVGLEHSPILLFLNCHEILKYQCVIVCSCQEHAR